MANYSFDIVSDYDKAEINNVFDQTKREIASRYDFKNTPADIDWLDSEKTGLKVVGNSDYQIEAITDIIRKKLAARNQSQKLLDTTKEPTVSNLVTTKEIYFKKGLSSDNAKAISKEVQSSFKKVKTTIQGESIRVSAASKDDLQEVMRLIRSKDYDLPIEFINYR